MDSFFGIGLFELVMIAIVALLVLGPERLPGAMREVAKWMRQLRNLSSEFQSQFSEEFKMLDELDPRRIINEAIDPKTQPKPSTPASTKPNSTQQPKPLAAKPLTPSAPKPQAAPASAAAVAAVTNGEPKNTILPPKGKPDAVEAPIALSADAMADSAPMLEADNPPAEAVPPDEQKPEASQ